MVWEREGERNRGVRPPPECALRQVTALLSPAPLLEDGMYGVGCLEGRRGWKRKGVVRQALQTLCSGETAEKPQHIWKKKRVCSSSGEQRTALFVSRTLSKMSSTEATPERMVVVQQKDLTCSTYYYCAYDINALNKVRFFHTLNSF